MSKKTAQSQTRPIAEGGNEPLSRMAADQRSAFLAMALRMSWQLALVVLIPILSGVWLDKALKTGEAYTLIGLGVALVGSGVVMWQAVRAANRLPVPKLTEEQKRAIKKSYEEEDAEE